ncbi:Nucleoside-diphosphate-sugar epimerase [Bradyrhizobium lablabi]|uniref:Nucleoside-diphosphate-sugar epimerase n=1 Tax=Bradyrhizobium lablabi TaxID=722472 RepID=A0A1M7BEB6_9BRAD|nr:NAD-dependent epimerase/dehydratase family protein [Bradyrhizobium lablabi]SHL53293.1 Nucleoside-diphosphate-sugar epimerase [Bradyrhizobium lablabi]
MPGNRFTVIGGAGFIGSLLASYLRSSGSICTTPAKGDLKSLGRELGHVLYCAGTTADFRTRPFETVDAHVSLVNHVLARSRYQSFTYLSSTRVYIRTKTTSESTPIMVDPGDPEDLFNLSKLAGEALCRQYRDRNARSVRLSNVVGANFGSNDFLFSVIRDAVIRKHVVLQTTPDSEKDYIHCDDAVELITRIATQGTQPVYNVACGMNLTNSDIIGEVCRGSGASATFSPEARTIRFTPIEVGLIQSEFGFNARPVLPFIHELTLSAMASPG